MTNTPALEPLRPVAWLMVGNDIWRASLHRQLSAAKHPMVQWRLDARLIQALDPEQLAEALAAVLQDPPTVVRVVTEPGCKAEASRLLQRALKHAPSDLKAYMATAAAPFDGLIAALREPDGLAVARWLNGPRHRSPVRVYTVHGSGAQGVDLHRQADAAFEHWLEGFLQGAAADVLEEVYGPAREIGTDQPAAGEGGPLSTLPGQGNPQVLAPPPGWSQNATRSGRFSGAASSSVLPPLPGGTKALGPISGLLAQSLGKAEAATGEAADNYILQWPKDQPQRGNASVSVELDLQAAAWAGHRPHTLVLHPAGELLPLVLDIQVDHRPGTTGRWRVQASIDLSFKMFKALGATGAAVTVLPSEAAPPVH